MNIQLPQWLIDFWAIYGDVIAPILTTGITLLLTWMSIRIRNESAETSVKKWNSNSTDVTTYKQRR